MISHSLPREPHSMSQSLTLHYFPPSPSSVMLRTSKACRLGLCIGVGLRGMRADTHAHRVAFRFRRLAAVPQPFRSLSLTRHINPLNATVICLTCLFVQLAGNTTNTWCCGPCQSSYILTSHLLIMWACSDITVPADLGWGMWEVLWGTSWPPQKWGPRSVVSKAWVQAAQCCSSISTSQ